MDLALGPVPADAADLRSDPFLHERFVAVAARDHPLARRRRPVTPDLLAAAFVGRQVPSATGALSLGYFAGRGIDRPAGAVAGQRRGRQAGGTWPGWA